MVASPNDKPGILTGLARILHLHQLPQSVSPAASAGLPRKTTSSTEIPPISPLTSRSTSQPSLSLGKDIVSPRKQEGHDSPQLRAIAPITPVQGSTTAPRPASTSSVKWATAAHPSRPSPAPVRKGLIVTDYDRILDLVKTHRTIKLDEIARLLSMKEEQVAQELQTLEDNGLVDVKYPAFGEPLIYYKKPEA